MDRGRLTVLARQTADSLPQAAVTQDEHSPVRQTSLRRTAYTAGFMAGPGQPCPYRDQAEMEAWHAGRADHEAYCDRAW